MHPRAQAEFETSVTWYKDRSLKSATGFVEAVQNVLELIWQAPHRWRQEHHNYRSLGLRKYPFTIIHTIDEVNKEVLVIAIYHQKRNPKRKFRRR